jgi:queuine tRNA-ribosyltransferase
VIFYDFYSPRSPDSALWGYASFARLWQACARRRAAGFATTLCTYSSATPVRAAMMLAGFSVGAGASTSEKNETTVATTRPEELSKPLDRAWLDKWERSSKPLPRDWPEDRKEEARSRLTSLLQLLKP